MRNRGQPSQQGPKIRWQDRNHCCQSHPAMHFYDRDGAFTISNRIHTGQASYNDKC
jgi:hypothetical protein